MTMPPETRLHFAPDEVNKVKRGGGKMSDATGEDGEMEETPMTLDHHVASFSFLQ